MMKRLFLHDMVWGLLETQGAFSGKDSIQENRGLILQRRETLGGSYRCAERALKRCGNETTK